jgi:ABC-2 type transport system permease protein
VAEEGAARAYWALFRGHARGQMSYRLSFTVDVLTNVSATALDVLTVLVLFTVTRTLGGFSFAETLVVTCLTACAFALADLVVGNIEKIKLYVRTGLFDAILLRPLGALPQLLLMDMPIRKFSRGLFGIAVYAVSLAYADIAWTPARAVLAVVAPLGAILFFAAVFVATATVAFWWTDSGEIGNAFTYGGRDFTSFPLTIYRGPLKMLFGYVLGYGLVGYYPALALLDRADPLGAPAWLRWAGPLCAMVAPVAAGLVWRSGLRHYRSTGS